MSRLFRLILAALVIGVPAVVWAQVPVPAVPVSVDILILPAVGDPVTTPPIAVRNTPLSLASAVCNLPALAPGPVPLVNPTQADFDDPFTPGRFCRALLPIGLPNGVGYRAVAVFKATGSADSDRSAVGVPPFTLLGPTVKPAAPTSVGIKP